MVNIRLSQSDIGEAPEKYCPNRATSTHRKTVKCVRQSSLHKSLPTPLPLQAQFIYATTFILVNSTFTNTRGLMNHKACSVSTWHKELTGVLQLHICVTTWHTAYSIRSTSTLVTFSFSRTIQHKLYHF